MKIQTISYADISGGAARAAYRIHHALRLAGVDCTMHVVRASAGDWTVRTAPGTLAKIGKLVRPQLAHLGRRLLKTGNPITHSPALFPSGWPGLINRSDADIAHLHWVCAEMMSVGDIGRIRKPVVWTLHDMWAFCGAEHVAPDFRWRDGYSHANRPSHESGFDLNRWVWRRKRNAWKRPLHIVAPSHWLADCARQSALMRNWPVTVIPNALDTESWRPVERQSARQLLNLPADVPLIAFGAVGNITADHKGLDLLLGALSHLQGKFQKLELVVFGQSRPENPPELGFPVHYTGHLHDDLSLRALYSAADALIIPSRHDNLPNTGIEAMACGTPVVAFRIGGLPDIVTHQRTGWLAEAFDPEDLAAGIRWVLSDEARRNGLRTAARADAVARFSYPVVAGQYRALYERVLTHGR